MSADNWAMCPRCFLNFTENYPELNVYKNVPTTLRENYEVGISLEGEFYVIYKAGCTECDFGFKHKYTKRIFPNEPM